MRRRLSIRREGSYLYYIGEFIYFRGRRTMLPTSTLEPPRAQLAYAQALHQRDLAEGFGAV